MPYSNEINVQVLISLLKQFNIRHVIASPGTCNVTFVHSLQQDDFFTLYSAVDERSAAYMACGLSAESGEPVVLSCTGATASRNYIPALTEAFYRKLPILAVTSMQQFYRVGQLYPQAIDRTVLPKDACIYSAQIPTIRCREDLRDCNIKINTALNMLTFEGGGPVHINLETTFSKEYNVQNLPVARKIEYANIKNMPVIEAGRIGIFIGTHKIFSKQEEELISKFAIKFNCPVFCNHTSNYKGKNKLIYNLVSDQKNLNPNILAMDLLIDIGSVSASYVKFFPGQVWRVAEDGKIQDRWGSLSYVFKMKEEDFFEYYISSHNRGHESNDYYNECLSVYNNISSLIPELPFSNAWVVKTISKLLPDDSVVHIGRSNISWCWHYFDIKSDIECYSNSGTYGIDGIMSAFFGSCLSSPSRLHYLFIGDLSFFYDINCLGNRHFPKNARILLINNGCGVTFKSFHNPAYELGDSANDYISAMGHFGNKSKLLVKDFSENLGLKYISASSKEEFNMRSSKFFEPINDKSIVFEVFTDYKSENEALELLSSIAV